MRTPHLDASKKLLFIDVFHMFADETNLIDSSYAQTVPFKIKKRRIICGA